MLLICGPVYNKSTFSLPRWPLIWVDIYFCLNNQTIFQSSKFGIWWFSAHILSFKYHKRQRKRVTIISPPSNNKCRLGYRLSSSITRFCVQRGDYKCIAYHILNISLVRYPLWTLPITLTLLLTEPHWNNCIIKGPMGAQIFHYLFPCCHCLAPGWPCCLQRCHYGPLRFLTKAHSKCDYWTLSPPNYATAASHYLNRSWIIASETTYLLPVT